MVPLSPIFLPPAYLNRAKEEEERANMNAEEVASIRAGFAPRPKRRVGGDGHRGVSSTGYIHSNLNSSKYNNIANTVKVSRASNGCSTAPTDSATASRATGSRPRRKEIGWLEVQRRRVESQRIAAERVAIAVAEGRSNAKRIKSQPTSSPDHGGHNTAVSGGALIQKDHNAHSNGDHLSHHGGGGVSGGRRSGPRGNDRILAYRNIEVVTLVLCFVETPAFPFFSVGRVVHCLSLWNCRAQRSAYSTLFRCASPTTAAKLIIPDAVL